MTHVYLSAVVPPPDVLDEAVLRQGVQEDHVPAPHALVQEVRVLALTGAHLSP